MLNHGLRRLKTLTQRSRIYLQECLNNKPRQTRLSAEKGKEEGRVLANASRHLQRTKTEKQLRAIEKAKALEARKQRAKLDNHISAYPRDWSEDCNIVLAQEERARTLKRQVAQGRGKGQALFRGRASPQGPSQGRGKGRGQSHGQLYTAQGQGVSSSENVTPSTVNAPLQPGHVIRHAVNGKRCLWLILCIRPS